MIRSILFFVATLVALTSAFTTPSHGGSMMSKKKVTFEPARVLVSTTTHQYRGRTFFMSDEKEGEAETKPAAPTGGTFYDDEVDPIPASKIGISNSMRDRLVREASSGLDSEQKQTNVILYISVAVIVLIILGGGGILF